MKIRLLLTGGTIDKEYDELIGELGFDKTHIDHMLSVSRQTLELKTSEVMQIDSNDMGEAEREIIVNTCKAAPEHNIVITHGTDTMPVTALYLSEAKLNKVIVLTGAMVPYSFGISSDAMFNLGSAISFVQVLKPGVYIAMNGHFFAADNVKKDKSVGRFVTLDQ
jgi:L-asparaginase